MRTVRQDLRPVGRVPVCLLVMAMCHGAVTAQVIGRVSVSSAGSQGNGHSWSPSISADGRFVAFHSGARNLVAGDTNGESDVFVHDRQTGQTTRVSVSSAGREGNGYSGDASISADGRFVAFRSQAGNLVAGDTNGLGDIFVHDQQTGGTTRVSVSGSGQQGNNHSYEPSISADGRFVAFESVASNLVPGDTLYHDVFVHDRQTDETTRVSVSSSGDPAKGESQCPSISADGRFVAFHSRASNLVPGDTGDCDVFVHDRQTGETTRVSDQRWPGSYRPSISADGRFVAFESHRSSWVYSWGDIFVRDRQTGQAESIPVSWSGRYPGYSLMEPSMSADGRFVAFYSDETTLVPEDTNGYWDVFVHDWQTGLTARVSVSTSGDQGNSHSDEKPSISADGRVVAFASPANNLVHGDTNGTSDVFIARNPLYGGAADEPPTLSWSGGPGFESDGVDPDVGTPGQTLFRYRVKLTDPDGDEPDYVRVIIRKDGVRYLNRKMRPVRGAGPTISGRVYKFSLRDPLPPGTYEYRFRARDGDGFASGPPTDWQCGPSTLPELLFGTAPGLEDGVRPNTGMADDTVFFWKAIYRDNDGDPARFVRVLLWRDGSFHRALCMVNADPEPDPKAGVVYRARRRLPAGSYDFRFEAEDKDGRALGPASVKMSGLTVTAAAPLALTSLCAVPTNAGTQITFSVSSAARVQARILNIAGRPIKTLCGARDCDAGTNTLLWNAQSDRGFRAPHGTYLVEVTARAGDGSQTRALAQVRLDNR